MFMRFSNWVPSYEDSSPVAKHYREAVDNSFNIREKLDTFGEKLTSLKGYTNFVGNFSATMDSFPFEASPSFSKRSNKLSRSLDNLGVEKQKASGSLRRKKNWAHTSSSKSVLYSADIQYCRLKVQRLKSKSLSQSSMASRSGLKDLNGSLDERNVLSGSKSHSFHSSRDVHRSVQERRKRDVVGSDSFEKTRPGPSSHTCLAQPSTFEPLSRWVLVERNIERKVQQIRAYPQNTRFSSFLDSSYNGGHSTENICKGTATVKPGSDRFAEEFEADARDQISVEKRHKKHRSNVTSDASQMNIDKKAGRSFYYENEQPVGAYTCGRSTTLNIRKFFRHGSSLSTSEGSTSVASESSLRTAEREGTKQHQLERLEQTGHSLVPESLFVDPKGDHIVASGSTFLDSKSGNILTAQSAARERIFNGAERGSPRLSYAPSDQRRRKQLQDKPEMVPAASSSLVDITVNIAPHGFRKRFGDSGKTDSTNDAALLEFIKHDVNRSLKTLDELESNIDRASKFFDASVLTLSSPSTSKFISDEDKNSASKPDFSRGMKPSDDCVTPVSRHSLPLYRDKERLRGLSLGSRLEAHLAFGDRLTEMEKHLRSVEDILENEKTAEQSVGDGSGEMSHLPVANFADPDEILDYDRANILTKENVACSGSVTDEHKREGKDSENRLEPLKQLNYVTRVQDLSFSDSSIQPSKEKKKGYIGSFERKQDSTAELSEIPSTSRHFMEADVDRDSRQASLVPGERCSKKRDRPKRTELVNATLSALRNFYEAAVNYYTTRRRYLRNEKRLEEANELASEESTVFKLCVRLKRKYKESFGLNLPFRKFCDFHLRETTLLHQLTLEQIGKLKEAQRSTAEPRKRISRELTGLAHHQELKELAALLRRRDSVLNYRGSFEGDLTENEISSISNLSFSSTSSGPVKLLRKPSSEKQDMRVEIFSVDETREKILREELAEKRKEAEKLREKVREETDQRLRENIAKEKTDSLMAQIAAHEKYIDRTREDLCCLQSIEEASNASPHSNADRKSPILELSDESREIHSFGSLSRLASETPKSTRPSRIPTLANRLSSASASSNLTTTSTRTSQRTLADISSLQNFPDMAPLTSPGGRSDVSETSTLKDEKLANDPSLSVSTASDTSTIKDFLEDAENNTIDGECAAPPVEPFIVGEPKLSYEEEGLQNVSETGPELTDLGQKVSSDEIPGKATKDFEVCVETVLAQPAVVADTVTQNIGETFQKEEEEAIVRSATERVDENYAKGKYEGEDLETAHLLLSLSENRLSDARSTQKMLEHAELLVSLSDEKIAGHTEESAKCFAESQNVVQSSIVSGTSGESSLDSKCNLLLVDEKEERQTEISDGNSMAFVGISQLPNSVLAAVSPTKSIPGSSEESVLGNGNAFEMELTMDNKRDVEQNKFVTTSSGDTLENQSILMDNLDGLDERQGLAEAQKSVVSLSEKPDANASEVIEAGILLTPRVETKPKRFALNLSPLIVNHSPLPPRSPSPVSSRFITVAPSLASPRSPCSPVKRVMKVASSLTDDMLTKMMDDSLSHMLPILRARKQLGTSSEFDVTPVKGSGNVSFESISLFGNESFDLNKITAPTDILNVPSLDLSEASFSDRNADTELAVPEDTSLSNDEKVPECLLDKDEQQESQLALSTTTSSEDWKLDEESLQAAVVAFSQELWHQAEKENLFEINVEHDDLDHPARTSFKQMVADRCCEVAQKVFENRQQGRFLRINRLAPFRPKTVDELVSIMTREVIRQIYPVDERRGKKRWEIVGRDFGSPEEGILLEELYNDQERWRDLEQEEQEVVAELAAEVTRFQVDESFRAVVFSRREVS